MEHTINGEENGTMHAALCALNHQEDTLFFSFDILTAKEWNKIFCCKNWAVVFDVLHQQTVEGSILAFSVGFQGVRMHSERQAQLYLEA